MKMNMRITGGSKKGLTLFSPKGKHIRPSSDHIRQVIFNIIGHDLSKKKILDLFSGTGILGIEALSRSAEFACFVDNSSESLSLINRNIEKSGFKNRASIVKRDLTKRSSFRLKGKFDIVFIDPPYNTSLLKKALEMMPVKDLLSDDAIIVGRTSKRESLPSLINNMELLDMREYGDTKVWIYRYRRGEE